MTDAAKIEYVTGDQWIGEGFHTHREPVERTVMLALPLELDLGQKLMASLPCLVTAHLSHAGMTYLTLDDAVAFHGRTPREILSLPKGMNVLEGLTQECKQQVWAAVQTELQGE